MVQFPRAQIDRLVIRRGDDPPSPARLSSFRQMSRYVLLGEPGSGKSTAFAREAEIAGTGLVTAQAFVAGTRPNGGVAFIDALEEFRIGEAGADRLQSLIDALASSGYAGWRIACRAISLPPSDARRIEAGVGQFTTLQLEPLEPAEQYKILEVVGEADPAGFIGRVERMNAAGLLGNPSTLLLLRQTLVQARTAIRTRGALLAEATRQMSYEINPDLPERPDRPPAANIEAAAEIACLVLLLSARDDIWMHASLPPTYEVVTRDDLLPARIDTQALRYALDTAMFTGDGDTFMPAHRFVAEYLGGRALSRATAPENPHQPALSLDRAIAFLHGDDDHPAPALTGIYAWFVTSLATTIHAPRALMLVRKDPEAILFHGDPAMLPTEHRRALLAAVGREDPWFLAGYRGSTALAGLAGDDLAADMQAILKDPAETSHRRALIMMALAQGTPLPGLEPALRSIFIAEDTGHSDRRFALEALANIAGGTPETYRKLLDTIVGQNAPASISLRIELLSYLLPHASADEVRETIEAYGRTGDGVMGYARSLGRRLEQSPMPELFDRRIEVKRHTGQSREYEAASVVDRALAAAIAGSSELDADRLLDWLRNVGLADQSNPEEEVRNSISAWLDADLGRENQLFAAIVARTAPDDLWQTGFDYERLAGRPPPNSVRLEAVERAEAAQTADEVAKAAELAFGLVRRAADNGDLYWRLWAALESKTGGEQILSSMSVCEVGVWEAKSAVQRRDRAAAREMRREADRQWYRDHLDDVRQGLGTGHAYAAQFYLGHRDGDGEAGPERLMEWIGDPEIVAAIRSGWDVLAHEPGPTAYQAGRRAAGSTVFNIDLIAVVWADASLRDGKVLDVSAATLLRIAANAYSLSNDRGEAVRSAALSQLYLDTKAANALLSFWKGGIAVGASDLQLSHYLDTEAAAVRRAIERLLTRQPSLPDAILRDALTLASRSLTRAALKAMAAAALCVPLSDVARRLWSFVAWIIDPASQPDIVAREFADAGGRDHFAALVGGVLGSLAENDQERTLLRLETIITSLGPSHPPADRLSAVRADPAMVTSSAIDGLAATPTASAEATLERLIASRDLSAWSETLQHALARQRIVRRNAQFRPPEPRAVAAAILSGPPATAADLRAIITEILKQLAFDIRHGDTSPWKGFWNRPSRTNIVPNPVNTPKIENDCRDLLTDRLADRLGRFGIPARLVQTEDRSGNDRRADAMIILGDGAAAVPIEAKRHWNSELWTAIEDQLVPYCTTAGSNGHGIYLVFWFGPPQETPARPDGKARPVTAEEAHAALIEQLRPALVGAIDVVIIDVSEPCDAPH